MKARALPSFWEAYGRLPPSARRSARRAFRLWLRNPFHPSLHYKCIDRDEGVWSARVTLAFRALAIVQGDTATWFWIGDHEAYDRFIT